MTTFKDTEGHEWRLAVTVGAITRLRTEAGIDLNTVAAGGPGLADVLIPDAEGFVKGLWVLCRDQAEKLGVTRDQFADRIDGAAMEAAALALVEAAVDFFPRLRKTALKGRLPEVMRAVDAEIQARSGAAIDAALSGWKNSAGDSSASPGATPTA